MIKRMIRRQNISNAERLKNYNELEKVLEAVKKEKQEKINKYGRENYKMYMERQAKSDLYNRFKRIGGKK